MENERDNSVTQEKGTLGFKITLGVLGVCIVVLAGAILFNIMYEDSSDSIIPLPQLKSMEYGEEASIDVGETVNYYDNLMREATNDFDLSQVYFDEAMTLFSGSNHDIAHKDRVIEDINRAYDLNPTDEIKYWKDVFETEGVWESSSDTLDSRGGKDEE